MFVRQLIGRQAGTIVDMPFSAAQSCLSMGSVATVTEAEILAAGMQIERQGHHTETVASLPRGYTTTVRPDGGYDLFHGLVPEDGTGALNGDAPLHNLAAARDMAHQHHAANAPADDTADNGTGHEGDEDTVEIPDDFRTLSLVELRSLAQALGLSVTKKAEIIAGIEELLVEKED